MESGAALSNAVFGAPMVLPARGGSWNEMLTAQLQAKLDEIGFKALLFDQKITASFAVFKTRRDGNIANEFLVEPSTNGVGTVNYNRFFVYLTPSSHWGLRRIYFSLGARF